MKIKESELIINPDGSVYHLRLRPEHLRKDIITVGDPARIDVIAEYFDTIIFEQTNREFRTIIGRIGTKEIMVVGTGIGTDNMDIVINELDILANIDIAERSIKKEFLKLNFYRLGTSGALIDEIEIDSILISSYGLGMDGLMRFYKYDKSNEVSALESSFSEFASLAHITTDAYASAAGNTIIQRFEATNWPKGITLTNPGFYGPQGRKIRYSLANDGYLDSLRSFQFLGLSITNLEMETAGLYGLCNMLGHEGISLNAIIANRSKGIFSADAGKTVRRLIKESLGIIIQK